MESEQVNNHFIASQMEAQARNCIPDMFSGRYHSVLYVGAGQQTNHFLDYFTESYARVSILEIFSKNVEYLKRMFSGPGIDVVCDDVRNVSRRFSERFDITVFYHGPERLAGFEEAGDILKCLESVTDGTVVLGTPYEYRSDDKYYGNSHDIQRWDIYPEDLRDLGYETDIIRMDDCPSNMLAWKRTGIFRD